jgi:subtilisin-like proprotein convertase family protein
MAETLERRTLLASISGTVYRDADNDGTRDAAENSVTGITVYQDVNDNKVFDPGTSSFGFKGGPRNIRDFTTINVPIVVSGVEGTVHDLNVMVDIEHTYALDLTAYLVSPQGTRVLLFDNVGSEGGGEGFYGTILDDEAEFPINDGLDPFAWTYQPMEFLNKVDGEPVNGTWTLQVSDSAAGDPGILHTWGLIFTGEDAEPSTQTDFEGHYEFADLPAGTHRIRQVLADGESQTEPANNGGHVVTVTADQVVANRNFGLRSGAPVVEVAGRHTFYNNSTFDGRDPNASAADDAAIAYKDALLPGQSASFANYTSYSRGINGVMVDIRNLPAGDGLSASDFMFGVGNNDDVGSWAVPSVEPSVTVRRGAGVSGSDRVTLTWPDGTIVGKWLQVTVQPTGNTGLPAADVFYFGNLPGETGNSTAAAAVTASDLLAIRANGMRSGATIDNAYDFNRDGRVDVLDQAAARARMGRSLHLLAAQSAAPAAPSPQPAASTFSTVPIARPTRTAHRPSRVWDLLA